MNIEEIYANYSQRRHLESDFGKELALEFPYKMIIDGVSKSFKWFERYKNSISYNDRKAPILGIHYFKTEEAMHLALVVKAEIEEEERLYRIEYPYSIMVHGKHTDDEVDELLKKTDYEYERSGRNFDLKTEEALNFIKLIM